MTGDPQREKMKLTDKTSARLKARRAFREWALAVAQRWGWDAAVQRCVDVMAYTRWNNHEEKLLLTYARQIGFPNMLREVAAIMEAHGCYLDVFCNRVKDDDEESTEPEESKVLALAE